MYIILHLKFLLQPVLLRGGGTNVFYGQCVIFHHRRQYQLSLHHRRRNHDRDIQHCSWYNVDVFRQVFFPAQTRRQMCTPSPSTIKLCLTQVALIPNYINCRLRAFRCRSLNLWSWFLLISTAPWDNSRSVVKGRGQDLPVYPRWTESNTWMDKPRSSGHLRLIIFSFVLPLFILT